MQRLALATLLLFGVRAFGALLAAVQHVYSRHPSSKDRPIKGILQVVSVVAHLITVIFIIAALMNKSPLILFSGLGAMTAILLLVFRDTLLSLVAGIQLTANDLVRVGDWIEMPQFNADGDVIDIALNSVSVQNWDKTITVIPTHKFLENSFKNWRGMRETGGRRIKRSLYIDMSAVRFLTDAEIERFGKFALLHDYIEAKREELAKHNLRQAAGPEIIANARRMTNIGTLRAYAINYLRQHPGVHQGMTLLVRQLQPTAEGLPLEIYTFTSDTAWAAYEGIQSDIFDHLLAILPEFGLRVFQSPSGHDMQALLEASRLQPA
jgi:miniconductance mechanosensitive channel